MNRAMRRRSGIIASPNATELRRVTFTTPICKICNKEVDKFEMQRNPEKGTIQLIAHCHGDVSTSKEVDEARMDSLYSFKAFLDPRRDSLMGRKIVTPDFREAPRAIFDERMARIKR